MLKPTLLTWILSIAGIILYLPAVYIQVLALAKPHDQKTKNLLVGKNEDYHDKTYFSLKMGSFAFFTYAWGLWFYWAIIVVIYSFVRIASIG